MREQEVGLSMHLLLRLSTLQLISQKGVHTAWPRKGTKAACTHFVNTPRNRANVNGSNLTYESFISTVR